jgi:hypothetical protein
MYKTITLLPGFCRESLERLDVWLLSLFQHLRPVVLKRLLKCGIVWKALALSPDELRFIGFFFKFLCAQAPRGLLA